MLKDFHVRMFFEAVPVNPVRENGTFLKTIGYQLTGPVYLTA